jgi:hypothetical protein
LAHLNQVRAYFPELTLAAIADRLTRRDGDGFDWRGLTDELHQNGAPTALHRELALEGLLCGRCGMWAEWAARDGLDGVGFFSVDRFFSAFDSHDKLQHLLKRAAAVAAPLLAAAVWLGLPQELLLAVLGCLAALLRGCDALVK